jgi:hypothetical protein
LFRSAGDFPSNNAILIRRISTFFLIRNQRCV